VEHFLTANWMLVLAALLVVAHVFLWGCASPGPYRTDKDPQHQIVEHFDAQGYDVGYVEFDEQGWFWMPDNGKDDIGHREQMLKVQDMVVSAAQYDPSRGPRRPSSWWPLSMDGGTTPPLIRR